MQNLISAVPSIAAAKAKSDTRVVVAMSGGVDSAVTAGILAKAGYDVVGVTLQLYDHGTAVGKKGACCAGQDIHDARRVADTLSIPHYVLDYEEKFRQSVIDPFADAYVQGETPIPCVACNQTVKFRDLLQVARDLGADALATGHYVRREEGAAGVEMHRAVDHSRDQSYFLFGTAKTQLDYLRFPLGGRPKDETRALAEELGLDVAAKPDSQDICFVPTGSYATLVQKLRPGTVEPGDIVHVDGRVLGQHTGVINYTIGQRKGLGIGGRAPDDTEPLFVVALDPQTHRVIVGPHAALGKRSLTLGAVNWLGDEDEAPASGTPVTVKMRSAQAPVSAKVFGQSDGSGIVLLDEPAFGIAPGQACVFYQGERVMGGGYIRTAHAE
ncbi:MAG: tRNA 2-thiouridine(34) synthase MnmA [Pseudomonadota bacterium]